MESRIPARGALVALLLAAAAPALADGTPVTAPAPAPAPAPEAPAAPAAEAKIALPDDVPADSWVAVTTGAETRVRAGPSINYRVLDRLPRGTWLVVTGKEGEFLRVRVPGGVPVFVSADLATPSADGKTVTVGRTDVLLRATPGQEYFPLEGQKLQKGDVCTLLGKEKGEKGDWYRVLPPARVEVFVHDSLLEKADAKAGDIAKRERERRDGFTGGGEAAAARAADAEREAVFRRVVAAAAGALAAAGEQGLPADAAGHARALQSVMTESGDPLLRREAATVAQGYASREKVALVADAKVDKDAVAVELEKRLAAIDAEYRRKQAELLQVAAKRAEPKFHAVGTVERNVDGSFELRKGGVTLHQVESLRYDLDEVAGLRVGVRGREVVVDRTKGLVLFRVDGLEILE